MKKIISKIINFIKRDRKTNFLEPIRHKKILRKNGHDRWVETFLNDTYFELAQEFPEDYAIPLNLIDNQ